HFTHFIEFCLTPFPHTPQGNFPDSSVTSEATLHFNTFVLAAFTISPFSSRPSFHDASLTNNSPSDSAINTRSSAYNNSHGSPHLDCIDSASNTIINNKGLSTEPWCTPIFTSSYIDCITLTNHSSTFSFLRDHQRISLGTMSNAFSKSTKAIHSSFFLHRYLSCSCLTMNMASVVPLPLLKPNCIPSKHTLDLTFPSITLSNIFIAWSNSFIPL